MNLSELIRYDQTLHNATRFLGRIGERFATPVADDEHTTAVWNDGRLVGAKFSHGDKELFAELDISNFTLHLGGATADVRTTDVSEVHSLLTSLGLDTALFGEVEFRFPDVEKGDFNVETVSLWKTLRDRANTSLASVADKAKTTSRVLVWPHNFDSGIFCTFDGDQALYAGFAPADSVCDSPYFYNSLYVGGELVPKGDERPALASGSWPSNWTGAVLALREFDDVDGFLKEVEPFLVGSTAALRGSAKD